MLNALVELAKNIVESFENVEGGVGHASSGSRTLQGDCSLLKELEKLLEEAAKDAHDVEELIAALVKALAKFEPIVTVPPEGSSPPPTGQHERWENQIANQVVEPLYLFYPTSLNSPDDDQSIEVILSRAVTSGSLVKAAGSGHSYSDVATTPDFFIDTHGLNKVASEEAPLVGQLSALELKSTVAMPLALAPIDWPNFDPDKNRALIETESGITIHDFNNVLEERNLGLSNMGGYDGQTMMGATATSTHGSGITLGPFPDMVRSMVLATTGKYAGDTVGGSDPGNGIYYYRIEPSDGITDPEKYQDPLVQLIQDDDTFYSSICSMGCFGVVYSVVVEVLQMYWLSETRTLTTLDKLIAAGQDVDGSLLPDPRNSHSLAAPLANTRNYEVLIHPYPMKDEKVLEMDPTAAPESYYPYFQCLVTARQMVARPHTILPRSGGRDPITVLLGKLKISFEILVAFLNMFPEFIPYAINAALAGLPDTDYVNKSFKIYNLGLNKDAGFATEIGFALEDAQGNYTADHFIAAINRIHRVAQRAREQGQQYQTSPFSLRFVKASAAHLSMMQGINTAMIEMDMITGTYAGPEVMYRYQQNMYELGGRPHWGLEFDNLTGSNNLIGKMYPLLDKWMASYRQFNAAGTFTNSFTDRVGFSTAEFSR